MSALSDTYAAQFHACSIKTEHAAEAQNITAQLQALQPLTQQPAVVTI